MGAYPYIKYNNEGDVEIHIKFNHVCYFPGEAIEGYIILIPKYNLIEEIIAHPQLNLKITQYQYYSYPVGSDIEHEEEELVLVSSNYNFDDFLNDNSSNSINIPNNFILPKHSYPSISAHGFDEPSYITEFKSEQSRNALIPFP